MPTTTRRVREHLDMVSIPNTNTVRSSSGKRAILGGIFPRRYGYWLLRIVFGVSLAALPQCISNNRSFLRRLNPSADHNIHSLQYYQIPSEVQWTCVKFVATHTIEEQIWREEVSANKFDSLAKIPKWKHLGKKMTAIYRGSRNIDHSGEFDAARPGSTIL